MQSPFPLLSRDRINNTGPSFLLHRRSAECDKDFYFLSTLWILSVGVKHLNSGPFFFFFAKIYIGCQGLVQGHPEKMLRGHLKRHLTRSVVQRTAKETNIPLLQKGHNSGVPLPWGENPGCPFYWYETTLVRAPSKEMYCTLGHRAARL